MGLDRVDVLFLHDAEDHFQAALHDGYPALAERRAQGVVIGAGMYHTANLTTLVRETDVDVVMLAGRYTLLNQRALDDLLPACAERGVSVLAAAVFNSACAPPRRCDATSRRSGPPYRRRCGPTCAARASWTSAHPCPYDPRHRDPASTRILPLSADVWKFVGGQELAGGRCSCQALGSAR